METTDELVTPGCPNCVIKHLSAAVALLANARVTDQLYIPVVDGVLDRELAMRAVINLTESRQGYESHFDYAVGLLVLAETVPLYDPYDARRRELYRSARLLLIERGNDPDAVSTAVARIVVSARSGVPEEYFGQIYAQAHITEALRESPESVRGTITGVTCMDDLQRAIRDVRKEFFSDFNEGVKPVEEKGEDDMATAKKAPVKAAKKEAVPAKKAVAAKATKAACKGGKSKKK